MELDEYSDAPLQRQWRPDGEIVSYDEWWVFMLSACYIAQGFHRSLHMSKRHLPTHLSVPVL